MNENDDNGVGATDSFLQGLRKFTEQFTGSTLELARNTAAMSAMFGDNWLRSSFLNQMEPERLEAMAEAGHFFRDARELAGLSVGELADSLGVSDKAVLEGVESGSSIMPLEMMMRSASLLARHDPIPFMMKFMRTYNPALEQALEQWGVLTLPRQYERERRFLNLYRQHDALRELSDEEHERFILYMQSSLDFVLDVMLKEKQAGEAAAAAVESESSKARKTARGKPKKPAAKRPATAAGAAKPRKRKRAPKVKPSDS